MASFTKKEIRAACRKLASGLKSGLNLRELLDKLAYAQPRHAEKWEEMSLAAAEGTPLSKLLEPHWPVSYTSAIHAGESSKRLIDTLKAISSIIVIEDRIKKMSRSMLQPVFIGLAGVVVFIFFMLKVIPGLPSRAGAEPSAVQQVSNMFIAATEYSGIIGGAMLAGIGFIIWLVRTDGFQIFAVSTLDSIPIAGKAFRNLYFSIWGRYLALMYASGISSREAIGLSKAVLPKAYQEEAEMFSEGIQYGIRKSIDPQLLPQHDPRRKWPDPFVMAFINSEDSGQLDEQLNDVVDDMEEEGVELFGSMFGTFRLVAMVFTAVLSLSPMLGYFLQLGASMKQMG